MKLIDKSTVVAEIENMKNKAYPNSEWNHGYVTSCEKLLSFINTLEVKEVNLEKEINEETDCLYNHTPNNPKITIGTKIRLKTNPNVILSIISDDCHEDEFECSNGSVLSLKQIEKYYDIIR